MHQSAATPHFKTPISLASFGTVVVAALTAKTFVSVTFVTDIRRATEAQFIRVASREASSSSTNARTWRLAIRAKENMFPSLKVSVPHLTRFHLFMGCCCCLPSPWCELSCNS